MLARVAPGTGMGNMDLTGQGWGIWGREGREGRRRKGGGVLVHIDLI